MSGTNHAQSDAWGGPHPAFVLVAPQMGENIGAAARAMLNFGLERLRLVAPRDGWPNPKAVAMASGAARVLDQVQVFGGTDDALADVNYVFATTARHRDLTKPVVTPERAMRQARALTNSGQTVAVLFGPERAGLENSDIARADALISVPVSPAFGSLNLAQCVLLSAYEWHRSAEPLGKDDMTFGKTRFASNIEVRKLFDHFERDLDAARFFWPASKADSMKLHLRNMFSRLPLTDADIRIFHGILRALGKPGKTDPPRD